MWLFSFKANEIFVFGDCMYRLCPTNKTLIKASSCTHSYPARRQRDIAICRTPDDHLQHLLVIDLRHAGFGWQPTCESYTDRLADWQVIRNEHCFQRHGSEHDIPDTRDVQDKLGVVYCPNGLLASTAWCCVCRSYTRRHNVIENSFRIAVIL